MFEPQTLFFTFDFIAKAVSLNQIMFTSHFQEPHAMYSARASCETQGKSVQLEVGS